MRTPRQLVFRNRNYSEARHSAGHSTASARRPKPDSGTAVGPALLVSGLIQFVVR